ncbi:hypothetical protein BGX27_005914, partial [Mortierella sp. AM989]
MSTPLHLHWVQDKVKDVEHVSFESFVKHFKLTDRQSAKDLYTELIDSAHQEDIFWSERRLEISSEIIANDAGVAVQEAGRVRCQEWFTKLLSKETATEVKSSETSLKVSEKCAHCPNHAHS